MNNPVPHYDVHLAADGSGYIHNGTLYERLTHILDAQYPYLGPTDNGAGKARGTYVHSCFAALLEDDLELEAVDPRYRGYVDALQAFMSTARFSVFAVEIPLWHPWGYGCTLDVALTMDAWRSVLELKTGTMEHVGLQLAAQAIAWNANFPDRPMSETGYCLKVNENGSYALHRYDLVEARADWAATLRVHQYKQRRG